MLYLFITIFSFSALAQENIKWQIPLLDNAPKDYVSFTSKIKKIRYFQKHPKVKYSNTCKDLSFIQTDAENFNNIKLPLVPAKPILRRVVVAIIDTGIDFKNKHLVQRIHKTKKFKSYDDYDFSIQQTGQMKTQDYHGHGTHVAGLVLAAFPKAWILPLKFYQDAATGVQNTKASIKALRYAIEANVDVINYSGGGPSFDKEELALLEEAMKKNILVISAAGNEKSNIDLPDSKYYPASYGLENIIVVGNLSSSTSSPYNSSNFGRDSVDIFAPGVNLLSYGINETECAKVMTGTSMSTPLVAGTIAYILATNNLTKLQAKEYLLKNSQNFERMQEFSKNGLVLGKLAQK